MMATYYKVAVKDAGCDRLHIPESDHYSYIGLGLTFDTESEAIKKALECLRTGRFTSARVVRFETEVVQTYNKEEVQE